MIRHILLVRASGESGLRLSALFARIAALQGRLPGLLAVTFGPSKSPENLERGFTHGLVADFADWDALRRYADDAEHQEVGAELIMAAKGGVDGLLVVDLQL